MLMRLAAVMTAAIVTASGVAQDSRAEAARLHELVDRRIEELRAELHREIDAALGTAAASASEWNAAGVSDEFRKLHRLPPRCGVRVRAPSVTIGSDLVRLERGDVLVLVNGRPITTPSDVLLVLGQGGAATIPDVVFIRRHEWMTILGGTAWGIDRVPILAEPSRPLETADQMVDRLWDRAVRDAMKGGFEQINPGNPVSESQPRPK